jgi:hypothetical protein
LIAQLRAALAPLGGVYYFQMFFGRIGIAKQRQRYIVPDSAFGCSRIIPSKIAAIELARGAASVEGMILLEFCERV